MGRRYFNDTEYFESAHWCDRVLKEAYWATRDRRRPRVDILDEVPEEYRGDVLDDLWWEHRSPENDPDRDRAWVRNVGILLNEAKKRWSHGEEG